MAKVLPLLQSVALFAVALPAIAQQPDATATQPAVPAAVATAPTNPPDVAPAQAPATPNPPPPAAPPTYPAPSPAPAPVYAAPAPNTPMPQTTAPSAPPPTSPAYTNESPPANYNEGTSGVAEPPPPPAPSQEPSAKLPDFSIRVDPLNWLLEGRLGFELEAEVWKFVSVETIPIFVVNSKPPLLNLSGIPDTLSQQSNGLGSLAGASIGAGFWLNGKPFQGTVLRFYYTNYGYKYVAKENGIELDSVKHTERFLVGMLGSHSKWGPFTIGTGIGLGVELNRERRCVDAIAGGHKTSGCTDDEIVLTVQRSTNAQTAVTGPWHPVYLLGRISLGVVF